MKLIFFDNETNINKYVIIKDKKIARINGRIFYSNVIDLLNEFFSNEFLEWENGFTDFSSSEIFTIIGSFNNKDEANNKFAEYLI